MLDAEGGERYEKIATQFAGVPEMMDRAANRLAASSEIPVTLLMGQAPAGLNATGDTDLRIFYDRIKSDQANILAPILIQLVHVTALALGIRGEHGVIFPSLFQETPKERREADKLLADTDAIYLDREVLTPEEVRARRFGPVVDPSESASVALMRQS
jgi:phage-related protein (TIGR01555 family)